MFDPWIVGLGLVLVVVSIVVAVYPWRHARVWAGISALGLMVLVLALYAVTGSFFALRAHRVHVDAAQRARAVLQQSDGVLGLIRRIQNKVDQHPDDVQGWYLLGRLYASQQQWTHAQQAFAHAYRQAPQDEKILVNYAQSVLMNTRKPFVLHLRRALADRLQQHPQSMDVLMLLAQDAYWRHDKNQAMTYWNQLLLLLPPESKEAKQLRQRMVEIMQVT